MTKWYTYDYREIYIYIYIYMTGYSYLLVVTDKMQVPCKSQQALQIEVRAHTYIPSVIYDQRETLILMYVRSVRLQ